MSDCMSCDMGLCVLHPDEVSKLRARVAVLEEALRSIAKRTEELNSPASRFVNRTANRALKGGNGG